MGQKIQEVTKVQGVACSISSDRSLLSRYLQRYKFLPFWPVLPLAVPDLKRKRQKSGLNRKLLDVAIGMIRESIKYKLDEAGGIFLEAPTQQLKPTQRCRECWELTPKTLNDRVHVCSHCGHIEDRDINSAQVCLTWARGQELSSLDAESRSSTDCGSMKQLWARKRQKPRAPGSSAG